MSVLSARSYVSLSRLSFRQSAIRSLPRLVIRLWSSGAIQPFSAIRFVLPTSRSRFVNLSTCRSKRTCSTMWLLSRISVRNSSWAAGGRSAAAGCMRGGRAIGVIVIGERTAESWISENISDVGRPRDRLRGIIWGFTDRSLPTISKRVAGDTWAANRAVRFGIR